ncbi:MAG: hypothetical protein SX243_05230 [Acidobacteriota bacterium]|nr:hypothetical protein [Acidobacteriota bacterium]
MLKRWWPAKAPSRPRQPLPEALRRRLQQIPSQEVLCRDFDRLWPDYLPSVRPSALTELPKTEPPEPGPPELDESLRRGLERHLSSCPRCRALSEVFAPVLATAPEPLPPRLAASLRSLPRRRRPLPFYLGDARYAAAASWLLALALVLLLGGPAAIAERTPEVFERPVRRAAAELGELGQQGQSFLGRLEGQARSYGENLNQEWRKVGDGLQRWSEKSWKTPGAQPAPDGGASLDTDPDGEAPDSQEP